VKIEEDSGDKGKRKGIIDGRVLNLIISQIQCRTEERYREARRKLSISQGKQEEKFASSQMILLELGSDGNTGHLKRRLENVEITLQKKKKRWGGVTKGRN